MNNSSSKEAIEAKYYKIDKDWDSLIWESFMSAEHQVDLWNSDETKNTYGVETNDGVRASWKQFQEHVEEGRFLYTDERTNILNQIEKEIIKHELPPISSESLTSNIDPNYEADVSDIQSYYVSIEEESELPDIKDM